MISEPDAAVARTTRLGLASWCLYDWANSAFPTIVTTFIFAVYFAQAVAANPVDGVVQWSHSVTVAALIVAFVGPALGAIADCLGPRKPLLFTFTILTAAATSALWWVKPSPQYALLGQVLYAAAAMAFGFAMVFYDAMLRSIAPPGYIGRLSGWGWALGYAGGLLSLTFCLVLLVKADPPPFGLARESYEHVRATAVLVALWFVLFSMPLFLFTPDRPSTGLSVAASVRTGLRSLFGTVGRMLKNRAIARFLLAHLFFTNGLNTLFAFGGIYAAGTFGMGFEEVLYFGIALNVTAGLGAATFAWVDDLIGSKRTVVIALCALSVLGLSLVLVEAKPLFFALGCLLGIFVGPAQAAGRALMARLAPQGQETEAFGLYELAGKATLFAGPLVLGVATDVFRSQRAGMSTILVFFVVGLVILLPLREPK
ncbi:MAG: MFS transporter [Hyphomicrobiaceae bacterium]|nr:MAG: MFS transporter [Hyphomicrobiaceae bacterium]